MNPRQFFIGRAIVFLAIVVVIVIAVIFSEYLLPEKEETLNEIIYEQWGQSTDIDTGASFRYPRTLSTLYINTVDWPPHVQIIEELFTCTEAGGEFDRAGGTKKIVVEAREYCVTQVSEGAAGSIYTQYAYAFSHNEKTAILTFSLRFSQCENYEEEKRKACEEERRVFQIEKIIDQIAQTLKIS